MRKIKDDNTKYLCTKCGLPTAPKTKRKIGRNGRSECCNAKWVVDG